MAYKPTQDQLQNRTSRVIETFYGSHEGYGRPDQPAETAFVCDFDFHYKKPTLRAGKRKNMLLGYSASVDSMINITIGDWNLLGEIHGGVLDVHPVSDVLAGLRKYYTVREVNATFTVEELQAKTVRELHPGVRT